MPITLPPLSRRRFLSGTLAAGAGLALGRPLRAEEEKAPQSDPDRIALFSDTHINAKAETAVRGTNMTDNLRQVCGEITALERSPAVALVDGDLAHLNGEEGDYAAVVELVRPLRERGLPVHLCLGNHDNRERFWKAIPADAGQDKAVENRHISLVESPRANWFLLDTLIETNKTPGLLDEAQRKWLAAALDERKDKPAIVLTHHQPDPSGKMGLIDTAELLELLLSRHQVKALIFGHTHDWNQKQRDGLHLVNLPPVAYTFAKGKPNGWVDCQLTDSGAKLQLHCIDPKHDSHEQKVELEWRG